MRARRFTGVIIALPASPVFLRRLKFIVDLEVAPTLGRVNSDSGRSAAAVTNFETFCAVK
jgi:hypothetical protein